MNKEEIKEYFRPLVLTPLSEVSDYANAMVVLVTRLEDYIETLDTQVFHNCLRLNIANHDGYVAISYNFSSKRYRLEGYSDPYKISSFGDLVLSSEIWNPENPSTELDSFIERLKPKLQVGWKSNISLNPNFWY